MGLVAFGFLISINIEIRWISLNLMTLTAIPQASSSQRTKTDSIITTDLKIDKSYLKKIATD
jgi:hypothetical protein